VKESLQPLVPIAQSLIAGDHVHTDACEHVHTDVVSQGRLISDALDLSAHTTFHTGGPANSIVVARSEQELVAAVREADESGTPVLVLSGGSNVLVSDEGFDGVVVLVASAGISADVSACAGAYLTIQAGETWDHVVAQSVEQGWMGLEALSGIPGLVGAAPVQNIGAYGAQVADSIARVRTYDREKAQVKTFAAGDCGFGYRTSVFKANPGRYLILSVDLQLKIADLSWGVKYAELARYLGVEVGTRVPTSDVRQAVLSLRASKGMVLDETDHDTWSAGSFFTNPVVAPEVADALPEGAPRFPGPDGVKTSAAWLIEHAGFPKGYGRGAASLSTKHVLALTNRGQATTSDIAALAREIRDGVRTMYGVTLLPEPVFVGVEW
jgi:UDP-N-acetylmuramate dehydrogenase